MSQIVEFKIVQVISVNMKNSLKNQQHIINQH